MLRIEINNIIHVVKYEYDANFKPIYALRFHVTKISMHGLKASEIMSTFPFYLSVWIDHCWSLIRIISHTKQWRFVQVSIFQHSLWIFIWQNISISNVKDHPASFLDGNLLCLHTIIRILLRSERPVLVSNLIWITVWKSTGG